MSVYILEGRGVVEIGEETEEVERDAVIDSPTGIPHLLRNTGDGVFRFLVVKLPRPNNSISTPSLLFNWMNGIGSSVAAISRFTRHNVETTQWNIQRLPAARTLS